MSHDERLLQISVLEFVLRQDVMLTTFSKLVLVRFQNLEDTRRMRAQLEQLPDCDDKAALVEKLSALERSVDASEDTRLLTVLLSRQESYHEKMEAVLAAMRASLPPPPS